MTSQQSSIVQKVRSGFEFAMMLFGSLVTGIVIGTIVGLIITQQELKIEAFII